DPSIARRIATSAILWRDAPDHTRLRRLVNKVFTPRATERMRDQIEASVLTLLDAALADRDHMDLHRDFATPLPTIVIMGLMGLDPADPVFGAPEFFELSDLFVGVTEPTVTEEKVTAADAVFKAAYDHILTQAEKRRSDPGDDLLTALVLAQDGDDRFSDDELVAMVSFLIVAGHETTANLIANATMHLLGAPEQMELLRRSPELAPSATEEALRFETSARNATPRWARHDLELGGQQVIKGEKLVVAVSAANRDPR